MSDPTESKQGSGTSFARVLAGGVVGFILGAFVMNVAGHGAESPQKKAEDPLAGAQLVPVVVAAVDIPEGTAVTFDHLQQRSAPQQLVTSSVVKPESANYIVNAKLLVPVQKGDMLLWSQFETKPDTSKAPAPVSDSQVK
jgi:pilus assembly protein CpaB